MPASNGVTEKIGGHLGIIEDAEPILGFANGAPIGIMDSCLNYVPSGSSRLAVRGGTKSKLTLLDSGAAALSNVLSISRYSQSGAFFVGHRAATSKHWGYLYSADLATPNGANPIDLTAATFGWNTAAPARPHMTELFEKMYVADATRVTPGSRGQLLSINSGGAVTGVDSDFGAGAEHNRPFCIATYNNVLFVSGQDSGVTAAPAMVRHSFLGVSPDAANGFDKDAYNTIGARGEYVTSMVPGTNALLIAKENELYRLTGFGRAVSGWQYTVTPLDNTAGVGVKWPRAMTYAEGLWYGIGDAGPFVTDGIKNIEVIVRPRRRSWRSIISLDKAVVRYNPERRVVSFGVMLTGDTAIKTLWLYDIDSQGWVADWPLPATIVDMYSIVSGTALGPSAAPTALSITHASATLTSVTGAFTVGDASASTEVWVNAGGGYYLDQTLAATVNAFTTVVALASSLNLQVKIRHTKDSIPGAFISEVQGYTKLATPSVSQVLPKQYDYVNLSYVQNADGRTLYLKRAAATIATFTLLPSGTYAFMDDNGGAGLACGNSFAYTVISEDLSWPAAIQQSATGSGSGDTDCSVPR
jgi:hypothetical protein